MNKHIAEAAIARIDEQATKRQKEAAKLYFRALEGDQQAKFRLQEGISTSDIPALLTPAINVNFLAQYAAQPTVWNQIAQEQTMPTLGTIEFGGFDIDTSTLPGESDGEPYIAGSLAGVAEYGEYPAVNFTTETLNAELRKDGLRMRISWEALRKLGNFDILNRATQAFSQYAARTEDIKLARQFVTPTGIAAPFNGRGIAGNPALTLSGLEAAKAASKAAQRAAGNYANSGFQLITGTALSETALNLKSITSIERTDANGVYQQSATTITGNITPIEFDALDAVGGASTENAWFLLPTGGPRPTFIEVFLEGARTPMISVKDSGHFYLGGGDVPFREGSFDEDDVQTRARHVVGAAPVELAGAVYSDPA